MADKQTLQQFGASIKAKHPEYKDMDDVGVGKAVLAKYPQYNDMVEQTPTSTDPSGRTPTGEPAVGDTRNGVQLIFICGAWLGMALENAYITKHHPACTSPYTETR